MTLQPLGEGEKSKSLEDLGDGEGKYRIKETPSKGVKTGSRTFQEKNAADCEPCPTSRLLEKAKGRSLKGEILRTATPEKYGKA